MDSVLEVRNLTVVFDTDEGTLTAVDAVDLTVQRGEVLGLVGESGCGKSVTALSLLRLVPSPPSRLVAGQVRFGGEDLLAVPLTRLREIRGQEISVIFQEPMTALSPLHRIGAQLVETVQMHRKISTREARQLGEEWLRRVGIPDAPQRLDAYPFELSGGMRQRVMIAMALMLEPKLVIADEPTTALDVTIQAQILDIMRDVRAESRSLLFITHDMGVIWELCDRVAVMYAAKIVEEGPVRPLFATPLHPYTQGLLKSMPVFAGAARRLPSIKGQVPSLLSLPLGCRFADRCPYAVERCRNESPELREFPGQRRVACFFAERWA